MFAAPSYRQSGLVYALFDPRFEFQQLYIGGTNDLKSCYRAHVNIAKRHCQTGEKLPQYDFWYASLYGWLITMLEDGVIPNIAILEFASPAGENNRFMESSWKFLARSKGWNVIAFQFYDNPLPALLERVEQINWQPLSIIDGWDMVSPKFKQSFAAS